MSAAETRRSFPVAELDRRFYAFVLDRLLVWLVYAVVAYAAYRFLIEPGRLWIGVGAIVAVVLLAWLATALTVGLAGITAAGSLVGLRVVSEASGGPIGVPRALVRGLVLGVLTLPTFGFGTAFLAVTAVGDPTGRRRGWHDLRAGSVVVDVRPEPEVILDEEQAPTPVVNLTALRLVPASPQPPSHVPARRSTAPQKPLPPRLGPSTPSESRASHTPRQNLGWPLVGTGPVTQDGAPATLGPDDPAMAPATTEQVSAAVTPSALQPGVGPAVEPAVEPAPAPGPPQPSVTPGPARHASTGPVEATVPSPGPSGSRAGASGGAESAGRTRWRVSFDTGETFEVSGLTLVGRKPEARADEPAKRLVTLPSDDMSLSKTHAQFQVVPDGALVVMDRGSTNGSILIRTGVTKQLTGGRPQTLRDGDRVRFGDREMAVAQVAG